VRLEADPSGPRLRGVQDVRLDAPAGVLRWTTPGRRHFLFVQEGPAQTFLLSFAAARLKTTAKGRFTVHAPTEGPRRL
jgi:hypothetical protein